MTGYAATLAYDGSAYCGFQRQPKPTPTIQGAVEAAIASVARQPVTVLGAGRTDSGVHAVGQVIAFDVDWKHSDDKLLLAINARLPMDIAVQDLRRQEGFHPRYDALWRRYVYRIAAKPTRHPLLNRSQKHCCRTKPGLRRAAEQPIRALPSDEFSSSRAGRI